MPSEPLYVKEAKSISKAKAIFTQNTYTVTLFKARILEAPGQVIDPRLILDKG